MSLLQLTSFNHGVCFRLGGSHASHGHGEQFTAPREDDDACPRATPTSTTTRFAAGLILNARAECVHCRQEMTIRFGHSSRGKLFVCVYACLL